MASKASELPAPDKPGQRRLFLKGGCPFCTRLVVFIADAGLKDKVKPIYDCPAVREYIKEVNDGRCSFPAMEISPGTTVMLETQAIIDLLKQENGVAEDALWASHYFEEGLFLSYRAMFGYLLKNEGGYPGAMAWFQKHSGVLKHPCPPEGAAEVL